MTEPDDAAPTDLVADDVAGDAADTAITEPLRLNPQNPQNAQDAQDGQTQADDADVEGPRRRARRERAERRAVQARATAIEQARRFLAERLLPAN